MNFIRCGLFVLVMVFSINASAAQVTGIIDGIYNDSTIKGWACVTTQTKSIPVHIYVGGHVGVGVALAADSASDYSEVAVDNACKHPGVRARHRFSYTFSEAQKSKYQGQKIYVHGIGSGVTNLLLGRSGSFVMPQPTPVSIGIIDKPEDDETIKGWACIKGRTDSVTVDVFAGNKLIRSVSASRAGVSAKDTLAIARECGHVGLTGNHRFFVSLSNQDRMAYGGQKLSARVRETSKWLTNHLKYSVSSDVKYLFAVNGSGSADEALLEWDYSKTKNCSSIKATVISFPGRGGDTHGDSVPYVRRVEEFLGQGDRCVRLIRANVNPGRYRAGGNVNQTGYWLRNDNFRDAASLMADIIKQANSRWVDLTGKHPAQGKIIVAGSSAGSMIAAAALEWLPDARYHDLVDRTIMISGPLGVDISRECGVLNDVGIKRWLDTIFNTGSECESQHCALSGECPDHPGADKDVVDVTNHIRRDYVLTPTDTDPHEISILVGSKDPLGCKDKEGFSDCGEWNAVGAAKRYTETISGYESVFVGSDFDGSAWPFRIFQIPGGTHDLWNSSDARRVICRNVLEEIGEDYGACARL